MGLVKGGFLRFFQTFLYVIAFCCSAIILGIYSYFLANLASRDLHIADRWRAVEGLSGSAVLYTIFAVLLTCCLAGVAFFSFLALILDLCFVGAMIAIAYFTREGANSCRGTVNTPLGIGLSNSSNPDLGLACKLNTACFAVSIIGAVIFLITALMQIVLYRNHKKEKRVGPSPDNNYTSGYSDRRFWQRKQKPVLEKDAELGTAGLAAPVVANDLRPSHDTSYTGATVAAPQAPFVKKELQPNPNPQSMYANMDREPSALHAPHVGWTPHSNGTVPNEALNPYGYENTTPARNF